MFWVKAALVAVAVNVALASGGRIEVTTKELPGGYGWEMWSTQTEAILARFLPIGTAPP